MINEFLKTRKAREWKYIRVYDWLKAEEGVQHIFERVGREKAYDVWAVF